MSNLLYDDLEKTSAQANSAIFATSAKYASSNLVLKFAALNYWAKQLDGWCNKLISSDSEYENWKKDTLNLSTAAASNLEVHFGKQVIPYLRITPDLTIGRKFENNWGGDEKHNIQRNAIAKLIELINEEKSRLLS